MWLSTLEIRAAWQLRSVAEIEPKSPFSYVNRGPILFGFRVSAKAAIHYSVNIASPSHQTNWFCLEDGVAVHRVDFFKLISICSGKSDQHPGTSSPYSCWSFLCMHEPSVGTDRYLRDSGAISFAFRREFSFWGIERSRSKRIQSR